MLRKSFVITSIMLLALMGCSSKKDAPSTGAQGPSIGAPATTTPAATSTPFTCPTAATRKFAKTRFITNAGLAAGAFKRYIYTPYRNGAFKSGASGRKRAIVKAGAAGVFVLDQLRRAKRNADADPTLCKVLHGPFQKLSALVGAMVAKIKKGQVDPNDIGSVGGAFEGLRGSAGSAGAGFKDKSVPPSMVGG